MIPMYIHDVEQLVRTYLLVELIPVYYQGYLRSFVIKELTVVRSVELCSRAQWPPRLQMCTHLPSLPLEGGGICEYRECHSLD